MVRLVVLLLLNMWALSSIAEQQLDAYRTESIVANQSEAERVSAAKATMGDVIVRITGNATALQHPLIRQAISEAPNFLLQFSYASERDANAANNAKPNGIKLILNYSPQAIEKLLLEAQLLQKPAQQIVLIQITNVQDFTAFKQAQAYLKTVSLIKQSDLLSIHKDVLIFNVVLKSDLTSLKSALELNPKWQAVDAMNIDTQSLPAQQSQLIFRWQYPS